MKDAQNIKGGLPKPTKAELLESRLSELIPFSPFPLTRHWVKHLRETVGGLSEADYQKMLQSWKDQKTSRETNEAPAPAMIEKPELVDDSVPFFKKTLPDGSMEWQMSGRLHQKRAELLKYADIEDKGIQAASVALLIAEARARKEDGLAPEELEYESYHL